MTDEKPNKTDRVQDVDDDDPPLPDTDPVPQDEPHPEDAPVTD